MNISEHRLLKIKIAISDPIRRSRIYWLRNSGTRARDDSLDNLEKRITSNVLKALNVKDSSDET